jgi:hypothetical protein
MWVIPKQLTTCPCVQGTVELISDCDQKSKILEQSAMWRSKPSPSKTWSRRLKQKSSISRLYTRILKPSRSASFVDAWTSSLVGSPASPSQAQEKRQGQKTLDISSPTSSKESKNVNPTSCSLKMSKGSSAQSSKATTGTTPKAHPFCSMPLESWNEWVTNRRREYSVRLKSVPRINEKECSSWRSPTASMSGAESGLTDKSGEPWKGDGRAYRADGTHKSWSLDLQVYVTPQIEESHNTSGNPQEQWGTRRASTTGMTYTLNPRWVEALMGLSIGWTMPSCTNPLTIVQKNSDCSEMGSSPIQQRGPSTSCGETWPTPPASQRDEEK